MRGCLAQRRRGLQSGSTEFVNICGAGFPLRFSARCFPGEWESVREELRSIAVRDGAGSSIIRQNQIQAGGFLHPDRLFPSPLITVALLTLGESSLPLSTPTMRMEA